MTETLPYNTAETLQLESLSHDQLRAHIAELDGRYDLLNADMAMAFQGYDELTQQQIDEGFTDAATRRMEDESRGRTDAPITTYLEQIGTIPEPIIGIATALDTVVTELEAAEAAREAFASERAGEVLQTVSALETEIDYDKVVAYMNALKNGVCKDQFVSFVIGARQLIASGAVFTYDQLDTIERSAQYYKTEFAEDGFLKVPGEPQDPATTDEGFENVPVTYEDLESLSDDVFEAERIAGEYHRPKAGPRTVTMFDIQNAGRFLKQTDTQPTVDGLLTLRHKFYNDDFIRALKRPLATLLASLPPQDYELDTNTEAYAEVIQAARAIDVEKALDELDVSSGFDRLPFALSETELKDFILQTVPPLAIARTKKITFRELSEAENPKQTTAAFNGPGDEPDTDQIVVNLPDIHSDHAQMMQLYGDSLGASYIDEQLKKWMLEDISHEYGHSLHRALPVGAIKTWLDIVGDDETKITDYVRDMHEEKHRDKNKEDFADSVKLFTHDPALLSIISNRRYVATKHIYQVFMPEYNQSLGKSQTAKIVSHKAILATVGISDADYKANYFKK